MILDDLIKALWKIREENGTGNLQVENEEGYSLNSIEVKDNAFDDDAPTKIIIKATGNVYR